MADKSAGHRVILFLGVLTMIATLVAAFPAYQQLTADKPLVRYAVDTSAILNPDSPEYERVREILRDNQVPDSRVIVSVVNNGHGPATEVELRIAATGPIRDITTSPSANENPVGVSLPADLQPIIGNKIASLVFSDLSVAKIVSVSVGYESEVAGEASVEVVFDGRPAERVSSVVAEEESALWAAIKMPVLILVAGALFTLLVAASTVIRNSPDIAEKLVSLLWNSIRMLFPF